MLSFSYPKCWISQCFERGLLWTAVLWTVCEVSYSVFLTVFSFLTRDVSLRFLPESWQLVFIKLSLFSCNLCCYSPINYINILQYTNKKMTKICILYLILKNIQWFLSYNSDEFRFSSESWWVVLLYVSICFPCQKNQNLVFHHY